MDASAHFRGKKITVMGLGLLGRGVGDTKYLAEQGAELIVTDLKSREQLAESVAQLENFKNVTFVLGEHRLEDFRGRDLILKAAGIPLDSPEIAEAKKNGIPVRMIADLFMQYSGIPAIGITGTRGKSTVTHMLAAILEAAGKKVLMGGNVRGVSTLALLDQVEGGEIAVLELDSWQCQGLAEAKISPHIAVFSTFYPDHLNYYDGDLDSYLADKANIFVYQKPEDMLILGSQCAPLIQENYQKFFTGKFEIWGANDLSSDWQLQIPGKHNRYNAALALGAARAAGIEDAVIRRALEEFKGVPGRLEFVREVQGVKFYNDTNSTTPEATLAALEALAPPKDSGAHQHLILIFGGADKKLDIRPLLEEIPISTKSVVMLGGSGSSLAAMMLPEAPVYDDLASALAEALRRASPGDTILFSPAFASFGMFKNEYDRGDQFNALVRALA